MDLLRAIGNIFRFMGRILTIIRNTIFNLIFFGLIAVIVIGFFSQRRQGMTTLPESTILSLDLNGDIVEERRQMPGFERYMEEYLGMDQQPQKLLLRDIVTAIDMAAEDDTISMILLDLQKLGVASIDQLQDIGMALERFRDNGKKVVAAQDFYTQKQYLLCSYADTVILNPMGGVELHGFGNYSLYFNELLQKLKVKYHIFRVGTYKSAIEPLIRDNMSEEARAQSRQWLDELWGEYGTTVAGHRNLKESALNDYVENFASNLLVTGGDTAQLAVNSGLVDLLMTRSELREYLREVSDQESADELNLISLGSYLANTKALDSITGSDADAVAVIVAEGNIVGGKQPPGIIGSETMADKIHQARLDDTIRAVVFRINSGGGSAFSSEIIRQEILELKKAGKPVVVSMGSMAASGAYWISADADKILAATTTLTGSIGIFGAIPTFEESLSTIGIHSDGVGTTSMAAGLNLAQPLPEQLKDSIQLSVENGYDRFLNIVAKGRGMERSRIAAIAEGRVYSGKEAVRLGLVDRIGTLDDAIALAAELADIDNLTPIYIEMKSSLSEMFLQQFTEALARNGTADTGLSQLAAHVFRLLGLELNIVPPLEDPCHIYAYSREAFSL